MTKNCLNCETELLGPYCHKCGQKASTHRITFKKFIEHDLLHGIFHLDKGVLYTLRALILSPGYAVRSFISGKRVQHYNIFALFIIIIALKTFIDGQVDNDLVLRSNETNVADERANQVVDNYYKVFYLFCIPVISLFTLLFFRKLKYNFTEHIVLNCFLLTGGFFYSLLFSLTGWLIRNEYLPLAGSAALLIYLLVGYYQATRQQYTFINYLWRVLSVMILFIAILITGFLLFLGYFYRQSFEGHIGFGN